MNPELLIDDHLDRYETWPFQPITSSEQKAGFSAGCIGFIGGFVAVSCLHNDSSHETQQEGGTSQYSPGSLISISQSESSHITGVPSIAINPAAVHFPSPSSEMRAGGIFGIIGVTVFAAVAATSAIRYLRHRRRVNFTCSVTAPEMETWLERKA